MERAQTSTAMEHELRALRSDFKRSQRDLPRAIAVAVQDAVVLARRAA